MTPIGMTISAAGKTGWPAARRTWPSVRDGLKPSVHLQRGASPLGILARAAAIGSLVALALALAAAVIPVAFGFHPVVVRGGSMGRSIPNGSLVMARWVPANEVRIGDVILIQEQRDTGRAIPKIHRVVSLQPDGGNFLARTRGDANASADPNLYVLPNRVLAPAYHLEYLGFLVGFVTTTLGWLVFIALPATLVCLFTLRSIWLPKPRTLPAAAQPAR